MKRDLRFEDDFLDEGFARYYTWVPGVGQVSRTPVGLAYQIVRAWDGPASAEDLLTIDSLGRPQSPTTQVVFGFSGDEWTLEILVEYDFEATRNGRHAYVWVVPGAAGQRMRESVAIVRSADLARESHSLRIETRRPDAEARSVVLTAMPAPRYWFRVSGARRKVTIDWSIDGVTFTTGLTTEWEAAHDSYSVVVNSSSFAGGAAFAIRALRLFDGEPIVAPLSPRVFRHEGGTGAEVEASDVLVALAAGDAVDVSDCIVRGLLDFRHVGRALDVPVQFSRSTFMGPIVASDVVRAKGSFSWEGCRFDEYVGLSGVRAEGPMRFVGCEFAGDTRFIGTHFLQGANFSGCRFTEKPFFRSAHVHGALSFYGATFARGPDLSSMRVEGDLSLADIAVDRGSLNVQRSHVKGVVRVLTTLQRDPEPLGNELDFSHTTLGMLVIAAGDRRNKSEHTGPACWEFPASVSLHLATVDRFEAYRVHVAGRFDISGSTLRSVLREEATFEQLLGSWPVFQSCFVSYAHQDEAFAARLVAGLKEHGVPCWFAAHDMKIGDAFRQRIEDEIARHDRLLLVLSAHSVESTWVREEVEACLEREQRQGRHILFPIYVDDAVWRTNRAWAASIRRQRHMGDFRAWRVEPSHADELAQLLNDLRVQPGGEA